MSLAKLLQDLEKLYHDKGTCDVTFVAGQDEVKLQAHKIFLKARCSSFQNVKRGEYCKIPDTTVNSLPGNNELTIRWPKANPQVLKEILLYVYCARIDFEDLDVFETLAIACELGIDDLREPCIDHINNNLCFHNACSYLTSSLQLENRLKDDRKNFARIFVDRCLSYVGEFASECVKTMSFLQLPKDALIRLVSSDCLALDEEDVWRAVLNWAKHQTGVNQPVSQWNDEDRSKICQALSGVISHVRILLIDSQVFAEEVEPTGAVPMEISLERYRFAALPNKFANSEDRRITPRVSDRLFHGTHLLTGNNLQFQKILNNWYGVPKQTWRLLFRAHTHGFSAESFHRHCDNFAPTFTVILGHNGDLCGGFTDIPWSVPQDPKGRYVTSEKSFLFSLINRESTEPLKFDVTKKRFAVVHHQRYGPAFGGGADLAISDNCNANMESYSNLPHSYDGEGACDTILMGDYYFCVKDYEVFTITSK